MRTKQDKDTAKPRVVLERTELAELEASLHGTVTLPKQTTLREGGSRESGGRETVAKETGARESAAKDGTSADGATKKQEEEESGSSKGGAKDSRPKDDVNEEETGKDNVNSQRELEESGSRDCGPSDTGHAHCSTASSDHEEGAVSTPPGRSADNAEEEPSSSTAAAPSVETPPVVDSVMDIINMVAEGYGGEAHLGNGVVDFDKTPSPRGSEASVVRPRSSSETSKKLPPKKRGKKDDKAKSSGAVENTTSLAKSASVSERLVGRAVAEGPSAISEHSTTVTSPAQGAFPIEEPKPKPKKSSKKRKLEEEEVNDIHNGMNKATKKQSKKKKKVAEVVDGECNHVDKPKTNITPGAKKTKSSGKQKAAPPRTTCSEGDQTLASDGLIGDQGITQGGSEKSEFFETVVTCASSSVSDATTTGAPPQEVKTKAKKKKSKAVKDPNASSVNPDTPSAFQDETKKKKKSKKKSKTSEDAAEASASSGNSSGVAEGSEKMDTTEGNEGSLKAEAIVTKKKKPKAPRKKPPVVQENGVATSEGEAAAAGVKPKKPSKPRKRKSDTAKEGQGEGEESEKVNAPSKKIKLEPKEDGTETSIAPKPKKKSRPKKKITAEASTSTIDGNKAAASSSGEGTSQEPGRGEADMVASSGESGDVKMEEAPKTDNEKNGEKKESEKKPKKQLDPVKCEDCGRECRGLSSLSRHMKQMHQKVLNPTKFHCERCEFTAPKRILLAAHLEIHGIYLCHRCGYRSENKDLVEEHKRTKHLAKDEVKQEGEKPTANPPPPKFHCEHCDFTAFKRTAFAAHLETHDVFLCHRCGYRTEDKDLLEDHINTKHLQREDVKLCRKCNRYIKGDQLPLEKHLEECKGPIPFACTECDRQFKYESLLKIHLHSHFPDQPKLHKCPHCDYTSNYKANLSNHISNLHVKRERHVKCPKCDKMFYNQGNMRRHLKLHTDERLYKCDKCDKAFRSRHSLRGHSTVHNPVTLKCAFDGCDKEFRSAKYYRIHKVEKHQNVAKKFACPFENCKFSFFKRSHLKRHEITHTGERNYHCPYPGCGKSFRHADNLKVHQRQHTNEKPVRCDFCDCAFRQRSSLHWHKKKFHGIGAKPSATQKPSTSGSKGGSKSPASAQKEASETGVSGSAEQNSSTEQDEGMNVKAEGAPTLDKADDDTSSSMPQLSEAKPFDMYEFMSDDEGEKSPVVFRRDLETYTPGVPPLPPPPESLLLKEAAKAEKKKKKKSKKKKKDDESVAQPGEPNDEGAERSSEQVDDEANTSTSLSSKTPKEKVTKKSKEKAKPPKPKAAKEKTAKSPKKAKESKKTTKKEMSSKNSKRAKAQKEDKTDKKAEGEKEEEEGQSNSDAEEQIKPVTTRKKAAAQMKASQKKSPAKKKTVAKKKAVKSPAIKSKKSPVKKSARLARSAKKTPSTPRGKTASKKKKAPAKKKASKSPKKSPAKKSLPKESQSKRRSAASIEAVEEEELDKNDEETMDEPVADHVKPSTKKAVVVGGKQAATLTPPDSLPDEEEERGVVHSPLDDPDADDDDNGNCDNDRDEEEMQQDDRSRSPSPAVEEHVEESVCALSDDGMGREELQESEGNQEERQEEDMSQEDQDNMDGYEGDEERHEERLEGDEEGDNTMMSSDDEMSNDIPLTPPRAPAPPPPQSPEYDEEEDLNPPEPPLSSPPQQVMMHSVGSEVHQVPSVEQLGSIGSNPEPCTPQSQPPPPPQPTPPTPAQFQQSIPTSEADKDLLGQYLQQLNLPEGGRDVSGDDPNRLQRLEELAEKPHESSSGGEGSIHVSSMEYTKSVITTNPNMAPLPAHVHDMSNRRMQILASDRQVEQHYLRDTPSTLPPPPARLPDPLREAPVPYEGFSTLNPLSLGSRDNNLLRSNENLFTAPTTGAGFMRLSESEAMLQRQRMTTPFLAQNDRTALPRIPETTLRPTNPALIRRPGTMPREEMFTAPTMPQAMPRNPFTSTWSGQEVRPAHWAQSPYLQPRPIDRQPNATATPFFPKDNYLTGREFVFDPTGRMTDRNMFATLSSPQPQRELAPDTFQLDRFDLSSYFSNYSGTASLDYSRSACGTAPKAFDERYRTPTATMGEFRGLPQSSTADMFSSIGVNSSFQLDKYVRDPPYPMYHPQMPGDTSSNSAFLTHPTPGQPPSVFDREYPHRSLYPQNTPYPFIDERQYPAAAKLSHPTAPAMTSQERDFMTRTNPAENQMQDPYRCGMLYMNRYPFDSV